MKTLRRENNSASRHLFMVKRLTKHIAAIDTRIDDQVGQMQEKVAFGPATYFLGNMLNTLLISALTRQAFQKKTVISVGRALAPFLLERVMVTISDKILKRNRPPVNGRRPVGVKPSGKSFPSGHASSASLSATLLSGKKPSLQIYTLAGLIAATRIWCRLHFLSDTIAGATIGFLFGLFINAREQVRRGHK